MRWSFPVFRIGETQVRIHATLPILLAWYAWDGWQAGGASGAIGESVFILLLFLSVLLHEFGHIFAARHYHIATPEILLSPIGGIARIAGMPEKPSEEVVVALAGPAVTLLIIVVLVAFLVLSSPGHRLDMQADSLWLLVASTNAYLLVFNLIPAFPMDGGRVLRALLSSKLGLARGTQIAARIGQAVALGLALVGFQSNRPILILIAGFVFLAAEAEYKQVQMRQSLGGLTAARITETNLIVLPPFFPLGQTLRQLDESAQPSLGVTDPDGRLLGTIDRKEVGGFVAQRGAEAAVSTVMTLPAPPLVIAATMPIDAAIQRLLGSGQDSLPVVDADGRFLGLVTRENVMRMLRVPQPTTRTTGGPA